MNTSENYGTIFPKGERAPADYFIGTVWIKNLVPADDTLNTVIANVVFEAGARNNWHTHAGGQILIATAGIGYYQEKGKPIRLMRAGDVVKILPGVLHWHGASRDSEFTHIAINPNIQKGVVEWLDRVSDEEYNSIL
ncbi:MAG TPA: cupin domain-containing protein [Chitinophagaceae bacterium]|jgi:quercetin dioxygenase-like cupin family protein|nr:cupin domain-containing protein [Chitinophagaceae bacterium]